MQGCSKLVLIELHRKHTVPMAGHWPFWALVRWAITRRKAPQSRQRMTSMFTSKFDLSGSCATLSPRSNWKGAPAGMVGVSILSSGCNWLNFEGLKGLSNLLQIVPHNAADFYCRQYSPTSPIPDGSRRDVQFLCELTLGKQSLLHAATVPQRSGTFHLPESPKWSSSCICYSLLRG